MRFGGITPWLKIAGMAEAFNLPVVSHGVPEIHVHLVGAVPNGLTVEYMPRLFHLWEEVPVPVDGALAMPTAPGLGLKFDERDNRQIPVGLRRNQVPVTIYHNPRCNTSRRTLALLREKGIEPRSSSI